MIFAYKSGITGTNTYKHMGKFMSQCKHLCIFTIAIIHEYHRSIGFSRKGETTTFFHVQSPMCIIPNNAIKKYTYTCFLHFFDKIIDGLVGRVKTKHPVNL